MHIDEDIKIAGLHPSKEEARVEDAADNVIDEKSNERAKNIGKLVAQKFLQDTSISGDEKFNNGELLLQRRILLSFAARIGFENCISDKTLSGIALNSFNDYLKSVGEDVYRSSSDMGAFSFYYLAFRRGDDVERRIGQTFAMLCSHDGDPIFQELGEALYCWFLSVTKKIISENQ